MSRKIIGVTVGTQLPKPNFKQDDPTKGDYIKNKPDFEGLKEQVNAVSGLVGDTSVSEQISTAIRENVSDWNAPEGESGHVLNRTHFKKKVSMLENAVCAFDTEIYYLPECGDLIVGDTYEITINGTSYTCNAFELDGCPWIGSEEYLEAYDPSVPIPFAFTQDTIGSQIYGVYGDLPAEITVSLTKIEYEKIPTEYLPKFDWDATKDEPGHINNRTHWREFVPADTFDGDLTGREYVDFGDGTYLVKISDVMPTVSDFIGQTLIIHDVASNADREYVLTENDVELQENDDGTKLIVVWNNDYEIAIQALLTGFPMEDGSIIPAGVYFSGDDTYYVKSVTGIKKYKYHPIDSKYLPEGVAEAATFTITITKDSNDNYIADKTYDEIEEAYDKGLTLKCELSNGNSFSLVDFNKSISFVMFAGFVVEDGLYIANGTIKELASITIDYSSKVTYRKMGIQNPSAITFRNAKYYTNKMNPSNTSIGTVEYSGDSSKFISGLPNPYPIIINGTSYDGSAEAEIAGLATEEYVDNAVTGLSNLVGDTAVSEQISEAIEQVKPNWEANEGEPGHIENRTHYKEYKLITSTEDENALYEPENDTTYLPVELDYDFTVGKGYKIVFNNNTYLCKCWEDKYGDRMVGSVDFDNDIIPFLMFVEGDGEEYNDICCYYATGTPEPSIYVYEEEIAQLDREYLPPVVKYVDIVEDSSIITGYSTTATPQQVASWHKDGYTIVARVITEDSLGTHPIFGTEYLPMTSFEIMLDDNGNERYQIRFTKVISVYNNSFSVEHYTIQNEFVSDPNVFWGSHNIQTIPVFTEDKLLPKYTSADEGKFLRIVNGVPTWVAIPSAEEASF